MTVDQRIAELEKKLTTLKWEYTGDAFNAKCYSPISVEESLWLIDQLKECREWRKTQEQGVREVVEQRTKEDCKTRAKAALDDAFGGRRVYDCRDKAINVVIQAIDSVGVAL